MKTFIQDGKLMNYANSGSAILSGAIVPIGNLLGVAAVNIDATTGTGAVAMEGVFSLNKATGETWAQGDPIFYDKSAINCTKTPTSNADTLIGHAWEAQLNADTTGLVKLLEGTGTKAAVVAAVATADATDLATSEALANALKVSLNAVIAALKAAGIMDN